MPLVESAEIGAMMRWRRELFETVGFVAAFALLIWGISSSRIDFLVFLLPWPIVGFGPIIFGPRRFRLVLVGVGAYVAVIYGWSHGFTTPLGMRHIAVGVALCLVGAFLTPRTQHALVVLRLLVAAVIATMYGAGFALVFRGSLDFGEGLGIGGLILFSPIMLPLLVCLVLRSRSYWRASNADIWHPSRFWDVRWEQGKSAATDSVPTEILQAAKMKQDRQRARSES